MKMAESFEAAATLIRNRANINHSSSVSTILEESGHVAVSTTDEIGSSHERSTINDHGNTITPASTTSIEPTSEELKRLFSRFEDNTNQTSV